MKESNIGMICLFAAGLVAVGGTAGWLGFRYGKDSATSETPVTESVVQAQALVKKIEPEPDPFPEITDEDIEALIEETEAPPDNPGRADMEERRKRWENMPMEQRAMLRKAMFSALAKVEGLEEVGDAIRQGKIDPRSFNINPEALADKMEFLAESMDQQAMEAEVSKTLQNIVDQARSQLK